MSINDYEILTEFNVLQNLDLCAQKSVCAINLGPFGEIGANYTLQLSSRTRLIKLIRKKLSPKINVKNIKKSSLPRL